MVRVSIALLAAASAGATRHYHADGAGVDAAAPPVLPNWDATWDMKRSTVIMPCNYTGFMDPAVYKDWGLVDFDWSNGRSVWSTAQPMTCQETLIEQATEIKTQTPTTKVFVYRNLVKALPWYTSVREKMTDPAYAGWFLRFGDQPTLNGTYHQPPCTGEKCSVFYHDQEQTPHAGGADAPTVAIEGDWAIYNNTNDVMSLHPGYATITDAGATASWETCRDAADKLGQKIFTWWPTKSGFGDCWCSEDWHTPPIPGGASKPQQPVAQALHVSGYKPAAGEAPPAPPAGGTGECLAGECDCGEGVPCGEYLWDHRNQSLRQWLLEEFILGNETGLGNPSVDGFYFDDSWHTAPATPSAPGVGQCSSSALGGASEENSWCSVDMGLSKQDVADITGNWTLTGQQAKAEVLAHGGFTWGAESLFVGTGARVQSKPPGAFPAGVLPQEPETCLGFMRAVCVNQTRFATGALLFELTRRTFNDPFPLPYPKQDVAQFLLTRGPFAWLGHNWMGCLADEFTPQLRPAELDVDYGVPLEDFCTETAAGSGVFTRSWSKVDVSLDCATFTATLDMKSV
jgi:hypothetical protein